MHLRSGPSVAAHVNGSHAQPHHRHGIAPPLKSATKGTTMSTATKKLILWLVLILQICFIACFWLLQQDFSAKITTNIIAETTTAKHFMHKTESIMNTGERVNFVTKNTRKPLRDGRRKQENLKPSTNFKKDFYLKPNRLNNTGTELEIEGEIELRETTTDTELWCFREGTLNETTSNSNMDDGDNMVDDLLSWNGEQCKCQANWHGKDCGQPEVIWRALMTAKGSFELLNPRNSQAHRLVFMLEGNFFSLDFLELQIRAVEEVVDYFLIYLKNDTAKLKQTKSLQRKLKNIFKSEQKYFVIFCSKLKVQEQNCTTGNAYKHFKKHLMEMPIRLHSTDLFLYTNDREILSQSALKFLKYYAVDVRLLRFRMKYNVYGFYWQHPQQTHLTGVISSFRHLHNPDLGNDDPTQLLRKANAALIIGDLNHFGGWFCKYCLQTEEIISELYAESSSLRQVQFPNATKNHLIDTAYLQKLIANGLYVAGRTQLQRVRRDINTYYAPSYANRNAWKYGHLLVNLYETIEDEEFDDDDGII